MQYGSLINALQCISWHICSMLYKPTTEQLGSYMRCSYRLSGYICCMYAMHQQQPSSIARLCSSVNKRPAIFTALYIRLMLSLLFTQVTKQLGSLSATHRTSLKCASYSYSSRIGCFGYSCTFATTANVT